MGTDAQDVGNFYSYNGRKIMKYIILTLTIILSACSPTKTSKHHQYESTQEKPEFYLGGFDGVWVGNVQQIKGNGYPFVAKGGHELSMMLVIREETVDILTGAAGKPLKQVHFNKINIVRHKTNAIIYAQHSESEKLNEEDKGEWVETWNMTLTLKKDGSVYIYLVRAVNNFLLSPEIYTDKETARFFYSWSGELNQVASIERVDDKKETNLIDQHPLGSAKNPIRASGPEGERQYLSRLICENDEPVSAFSRDGSSGIGPYGSILDIYTVVCDTDEGAINHTIFMDMYHDDYKEKRPAHGFKALKAEE
jgi:hypothetical protein